VSQLEQSQAVIAKFLENGRFEQRFETLSILGRGGFGVVYKARYLVDDNIYAVKKVKLHLGLAETLHNHKVYREIQTISKLEPKNILRYYTCWIEGLDSQEMTTEKKFIERLIKR
jgi:translation initiation factor 2-alpha kinase 4